MSLLRTYYWRYFKRKRLKLYRSIDDLPLYNWIKLLKTEDLKYLYVSSDYFGGFYYHNGLVDLFEQISIEYIDRFVVNEDYFLDLKLKADHLIKKIDASINHKALRLKILEGKEEGWKKEAQIDIEKMLAYVQRQSSYRINPKEVSVSEFYHQVEIIREINSKLKEDGKEDTQ